MKVALFVLVCLLWALAGCGSGPASEPASELVSEPSSEEGPEPATEPASPSSTSGEAPGIAASRRFMETWNTRDSARWAESLAFPHARPSAGSHRVWQTRREYVEGHSYDALVESGWDHTEFEDLRLVHQGDDKAHVAGRWGRVDIEGGKMRRNLVTYIATETDGEWGIRARFGAGAPLDEEAATPIAEKAIAKVEEYMAAFNSRDPKAWAATLNYPHLRIAGGDLVVTETEEEFAANMDFDAFADRFGWDRSDWDAIEAVQVAETGVNVALTFSRYDAGGEVLSTFHTLYLVTNENGRWGIRARSSFAP